MNEFLGITSTGLSRIAAEELRLFDCSVKLIGKSYVVFSCDSDEDLHELQSFHYVLKKLAVANTKAEMFGLLGAISLARHGYFIRCHPFNLELSKEIAIALKLSRDLERKATIHCFKVEGKYLVGIDIANRLMSKRRYRIFTSRYSLNSVTAFALALFTCENNCLFIITADGTPAVEWALLNKRLNRQVLITATAIDDILLRGARKNALVAGVANMIRFTKKPAKGAKAVVLPLNFKCTKTGIGYLELLERVVKEYSNVETLSIVVLSECERHILSQVNGFELHNRLDFLQGKLKLHFLKLKKTLSS